MALTPAGEPAPAGGTLDDVTLDGRGVQKRARIGPQRYLMFVALRTFSRLTAINIAEETRLSVKRIREQMMADARLGIVKDYGDAFELTKIGEDLLSRYESYKKSMGHALPTLADINEISGGDEEDDFDPYAEAPDSGKLSGAPRANGALPLAV